MRIVFTSIDQPVPPTVLPSWSGWGITFPMNCRGKIIPFPPLRHFEIFERHRIITCDNTAVMVSDLSPAILGPAADASCKTPRLLVNRQNAAPAFALPNSTAQKAVHDKYVGLAKH
jgi:hypothetical protein